MEESAITGRLSIVDEFVTPNRLRMLRELSDIYHEQRPQPLLTASAAPALHDACGDKDACWDGFPDAARPTNGESWGLPGDRPGSIIWPWIGEQYKTDGVVLLTLNFRSGDDDATVALEYLAAKHALSSLKANYKRDPKWNSTSTYGFLATAAAVLASLSGEPPMVEPEPELLYEMGTIERVARVQLVKCTPVDPPVKGGAPSSAMCERCPPGFLWKELDILLPHVLVAFGDDAFKALDARDEVKWRCGADHCRGTLDYGSGGQAILLWLWYPSRLGKWKRSQEALVRSLQRKPLRAA